jgi:hypothetical protein
VHGQRYNMWCWFSLHSISPHCLRRPGLNLAHAVWDPERRNVIGVMEQVSRSHCSFAYSLFLMLFKSCLCGWLLSGILTIGDSILCSTAEQSSKCPVCKGTVRSFNQYIL